MWLQFFLIFSLLFFFSLRTIYHIPKLYFRFTIDLIFFFQSSCTGRRVGFIETSGSIFRWPEYPHRKEQIFQVENFSCICMFKVSFCCYFGAIYVSLTSIFSVVSPFVRLLSMSPDVKVARIASLENMLGMSSVALKSMASQLTEAEERERTLNNRGRWNQLRSMGDAKNVLQYLFNATAEARCFWNLLRIWLSFSSFYLYQSRE